MKAWQDDYNHYRPHGSLGHLTPSEFASGQGNPRKRPTSSSKLSGFRGNVTRDVDNARHALCYTLSGCWPPLPVRIAHAGRGPL